MELIALKRLHGFKWNENRIRCIKRGGVALNKKENIILEKDQLEKLYLKENKTAKFIASVYGCEIHTVKRYLRKYKLACKYQADYQYNNLQIDFIIGSALGDGHLSTKNGSTSLYIGHAEDQKNYCNMKFEIIKEFCNYSELKFSDRSNDKDSLNRQNQYYFVTKNMIALNEYKAMDIKILLDNLNTNSFTIWMMDDGHKYKVRGKNKNSSYELSVGRFTQDEVSHAISIIDKRFGIKGGLKYNKNWVNPQYTLTFDVEQSYKLSNIMLDSDFGYILGESMSYKIIDKINKNRITKNYKSLEGVNK
jgi:hypothetical protein